MTEVLVKALGFTAWAGGRQPPEVTGAWVIVLYRDQMLELFGPDTTLDLGEPEDDFGAIDWTQAGRKNLGDIIAYKVLTTEEV